jgi:hypothetical protein
MGRAGVSYTHTGRLSQLEPGFARQASTSAHSPTRTQQASYPLPANLGLFAKRSHQTNHRLLGSQPPCHFCLWPNEPTRFGLKFPLIMPSYVTLPDQPDATNGHGESCFLVLIAAAVCNASTTLGVGICSSTAGSAVGRQSRLSANVVFLPKASSHSPMSTTIKIDGISQDCTADQCEIYCPGIFRLLLFVLR